MANSITRHIPNIVTCGNLFSGCIAAVMAFQANYQLAIAFIVIGAVFDFFDGMLARILHVSGPLGKELDSLADDITFGFAPAVIVFSLFKEVHYPAFLAPVEAYFPTLLSLLPYFQHSVWGNSTSTLDKPVRSSDCRLLPMPYSGVRWS